MPIITYKTVSGKNPDRRGVQGLPGNNPPLGPQGIQPSQSDALTGDLGTPGPTCACTLDQDIPEVKATGASHNDYLQYNQSKNKWEATQQVPLNRVDFSDLPTYSTQEEAYVTLGNNQLWTNNSRIRLTRPLIIQDQLAVHYRADNVDGLDSPGDQSTTTIKNLAPDYDGTYDGTLRNSNVDYNQGYQDSPFEYSFNLNVEGETGNGSHIEIGDSFFVNGGQNDTTQIEATWEFWISTNDDNVDQGTLYAEGPDDHNTNNDLRNTIIFDSSNQNYGFFTQGGSQILSSNNFYDELKYQQLVVTLSGGTLSFLQKIPNYLEQIQLAMSFHLHLLSDLSLE